MARHSTGLLGLLWLVALALPGQAQTRYWLTFPQAAQRYVRVEAHYPTGGAAQVDLFLPTWTPGDYVIRDFSQFLGKLSATGNDGQTLELQTLGKNRWRVGCAGKSEITLVYRVRGAQVPQVASNYVDSHMAIVQGAATFISPVKPLQPTFEVRVERPAGWKSIQTGFPPAPDGGEGHFLVSDFDQLIDCPIVAGSPTLQEFRVAGVRHVLVNLGQACKDPFGEARAARDVQKVVEAAHRLWGFFPFAQEPPQAYWFLNVDSLSGGGLEHKNSTCIRCNPGFQETRDSYVRWLSVVSHEYFHAWNGKKLRPVSLGPFDYEAKNYTPSLWIAEGLTTYYGNLLLARSGLTTGTDYMTTLSDHILAAKNYWGRCSLSEASMNVWDQPRIVGYYSGGAVVGFLLDQQIREATGGRASLDEVMRQAYRQYSGEHGYTEEQFEAVASQVAGINFSEFFRRHVRGTERLDFAPALRYYGLRIRPSPNSSAESGVGWKLGIDPAASPESRAHWEAYLKG